jgi:hypothetical protein
MAEQAGGGGGAGTAEQVWAKFTERCAEDGVQIPAGFDLAQAKLALKALSSPEVALRAAQILCVPEDGAGTTVNRLTAKSGLISRATMLSGEPRVTQRLLEAAVVIGVVRLPGVLPGLPRSVTAVPREPEGPTTTVVHPTSIGSPPQLQAVGAMTEPPGFTLPPQAINLGLNAMTAHLQVMLGNERTAFGHIANHMEVLKHHTVQLDALSAAQNRAQSILGGTAHLTELLWWGQARYSHLHRAPFRKLRPAQRRWAAALEAAERSGALPDRPAAAYLVGVLTDLQLDVDRVRPLRDWVADGYEELRGSKVLDRFPSGRLAELAKDDGTGLPVHLLVAHARRNGNAPDDAVLRSIHLDPEQPLDEGDWASWIYYELKLAQRLEASPGAAR